MIYAYPSQLSLGQDGGLVGGFPDVPEAIISGGDRVEALRMAEDALATALAGYVHEKRDIPILNGVSDGQVMVPVPTVVAGKLALSTAMKAQSITKVELARRLGVGESAVRKLTNPDHRSHMSQVQKALRAVGSRLQVEISPGGGDLRNLDHGSFFEEFVGALFDDLGCDLECQPAVNDRVSDFLATTPEGESFYVEATVLEPRQFSVPRATEEDVCKKLDQMCRVPYLYWFWASASGELYQHLSKKDLNPLKRWIERLGVEDLRLHTLGSRVGRLRARQMTCRDFGRLRLMRFPAQRRNGVFLTCCWLALGGAEV